MLKMKEVVIDKFIDSSRLEEKARAIRLMALSGLFESGLPYVGSAMSVIDILVSMYYGKLGSRNVMEADDKVVYGKGHVSMSLYAILSDLGFFDEEEMKMVGKEDAMLSFRPSSKVPGVDASVNEIGSALSIGMGMALSLKMDRKEDKVFTVIGDGELQCGQVWEAAMMAAHQRLDNLVAVIDNNKIQSGALISGVLDVGSIQDKFEAFGWKVILVADGHDYDKLLSAFEKALEVKRKPVCVWCRTVSGKGIDFAESKEGYHSSTLSSREFELIKSKMK